MDRCASARGHRLGFLVKGKGAVRAAWRFARRRPQRCRSRLARDGFVGRRFVKPLVALRDASVALGRGEAAVPVPLAASGEIGAVARAFEAMRAQLAARTREAEAEHQALLAAYERVRASEAEYRLLFHNSPLAKVLYDDATQQIVAANDAAVRAYGYSRIEFLGLRFPDLLAPQSRHKRKDGTLFDVHVYEQAFIHGGELQHLATVEDVTEKLRLEEQLRHAQKMEAVGRLAGGVAHDFNNVLSVIMTYSELLLAQVQDAPVREDVEEIRKAASRAVDLTRQLLAFSRQQVVEPKVLDLNAVLSGIDKMLHRILGADIDVVFAHGASLGKVRADRGSLEQVLVNLAVNARDAMPTGGRLRFETANIELDEAGARELPGTQPGAYVLLTVTDTGLGMDKPTMARIFEPFFTTKEKGKGTGLGLSTVLGIVQQSGGTLSVESEPGKGACFKIYLPRIDARVDTMRPARSEVAAGGSETILLVDDDDQVRGAAKAILDQIGYRVIEAPHAVQAQQASESHRGTIHLLLTDVVMPQMSGPELAKRLARDRPDMKLLCMSGYTDDSIVRHGVSASRLAYLQKPITPETLRAKVREVLDSVIPSAP